MVLLLERKHVYVVYNRRAETSRLVKYPWLLARNLTALTRRACCPAEPHNARRDVNALRRCFITEQNTRPSLWRVCVQLASIPCVGGALVVLAFLRGVAPAAAFGRCTTKVGRCTTKVSQQPEEDSSVTVDLMTQRDKSTPRHAPCPYRRRRCRPVMKIAVGGKVVEGENIAVTRWVDNENLDFVAAVIMFSLRCSTHPAGIDRLAGVLGRFSHKLFWCRALCFYIFAAVSHPLYLFWLI